MLNIHYLMILLSQRRATLCTTEIQSFYIPIMHLAIAEIRYLKSQRNKTFLELMRNVIFTEELPNADNSCRMIVATRL